MKNNNILNSIIFYSMLITILFMKYLIDANWITYIAPIGFFILFITRIKNNIYRYQKSNIIIMLVFILYILINYFFTSYHVYMKQELLITIDSLFVLFIIYYLLKEDFFNDNRCRFLFWFLNIYYIINFIFILMQIKYPGLLIRNFSINSYLEDQLCGLFGTNGTHRLSLFNMVLLYLNAYFVSNNYSKEKKFAKFFLIFVIISSIYISVFNDNRFYIVAFLYLILPLLLLLQSEKRKIGSKTLSTKKIKKLFIVTLILIIGVASYYTIKPLNSFIKEEIIENYFTKTIDRTANRNNKHEERLYLFRYAIEKGDGYKLGKGIGAVKLTNDPTMPRHFGLSEITSRVYNGGIIYIIILGLIYFSYYINFSKNKKSLIEKGYIIGFMALMAIYCQYFTKHDETFIFSLFFVFFIKFLDMITSNRQQLKRKEI